MDAITNTLKLVINSMFRLYMTSTPREEGIERMPVRKELFKTSPEQNQYRAYEVEQSYNTEICVLDYIIFQIGTCHYTYSMHAR